MLDCSSLTGRLREICEGTGRPLPAAKRDAYLRLWREQGLIDFEGAAPPPGKQGKSRGLGDTVDRITTATGIKRITKLAANLLGKKDCGCEKRREKLNKLVPYRSDSGHETTKDA